MQICELHFDDFSLYFLQSLSPEERATLPPPDSRLSNEWMKKSWRPVLELTHNHGTEKNKDFKYHDSNTEPKVRVLAMVIDLGFPPRISQIKLMETSAFFLFAVVTLVFPDTRVLLIRTVEGKMQLRCVLSWRESTCIHFQANNTVTDWASAAF